MEKLFWRALGLSVGVCVLSPFYLNGADPGVDLEGIKKKIETEKQGISQMQKKEGSVLQSLGKIQNELAKTTRELKIANANLAATLDEMNNKETEVESAHASIQQRQELLKKRAVALYRWQRGASLFVIFDGEVSLGMFLQRKRYLEATVAYDQNLVRRLNEEVQRYEILRQELAQKKEELDDRRQVLAKANEAVRREADKKRALLASLRQEKETRLRALKELEQAALRLEKMMKEMARTSAGRPADAPSRSGLEAMRGKLEWPVKGAIASAFGKTKHREFSAEVFQKGIAIEAPLGEEIRAVENGKVVFADHFTGYGKMVIVDHGERYFTIYAHLSEILKKTGHAVKRGEILGLVGDSDSLAGVKLYFEMRKDGRSIDPLPWFRRP